MPTSTKSREATVPAALTKTVQAPRILAADDQQHILDAIQLLLKPEGYRVDVVHSPEFAREALSTSQYDAVLIDLNYTRDTTSGREGLDLLSQIVARDSTLPVIVMTAWGNVDLAVEAMRRGACDFVQKPWDNNRLLATIRKQAEPVRRRKSELEIAANVQQKLFPRKLRRLESLDYAGHCLPAREVGGDYYDFLDLPGGIGFVLGDVSGKGVPA